MARPLDEILADIEALGKAGETLAEQIGALEKDRRLSEKDRPAEVYEKVLQPAFDDLPDQARTLLQELQERREILRSRIHPSETERMSLDSRDPYVQLLDLERQEAVVRKWRAKLSEIEAMDASKPSIAKRREAAFDDVLDGYHRAIEQGDRVTVEALNEVLPTSGLYGERDLAYHFPVWREAAARKLADPLTREAYDELDRMNSVDVQQKVVPVVETVKAKFTEAVERWKGEASKHGNPEDLDWNAVKWTPIPALEAERSIFREALDQNREAAKEQSRQSGVAGAVPYAGEVVAVGKEGGSDE